MALNFIDRYSSKLSADYISGGTSISVSSASGLPSGACDFYVIVRAVLDNGNADGANTEEVFHVTNRSGTTLTVTGAQAGTSASNHSTNAVIIGSIMTVAAFDQMRLDQHQTGAYSTRAASKAGNLFMPSDGPFVLRDTGAAFGRWGPLYPFTEFDPTAFAWQNQNVNGSTTTVDTSDGCITLTSDGAGDGVAGYVKSPVAATFTITGAVSHVATGNDGSHYSETGLMVSDGTKTIAFNYQVYNGTVYLRIDKWTNSTTYSATYNPPNNFVLPFSAPLLFQRIQETVSARNFYLSPNGRTWIQLLSTTNTDFLTTSKYGVHIRASLVSAASTLYSFGETNP